MTNRPPRPLAVGEDPSPMRPPSTNGANGRAPAERRKAKGPAAGRSTGDRFRVLNAFVDCTLAGLSRNEIAVWLILFRDERNGAARTGQNDLARRAGISARSVRRGLEGLRQRGLVQRVYQGGVGRGVSVYRIRAVPPQKVWDKLDRIGGQM